MDRSDFILRAATWEDAADVVEILNRCAQVEDPQPEHYLPDFTVEEQLAYWQEKALENDTLIATTLDGKVVGYTDINSWLDQESQHGHIMIDSCNGIDPAYRNQGIGTTFLQWVEKRARKHFPDLPVVIETGCYRTNIMARHLFVNQGYTLKPQSGWVILRINLQKQPQEPEWPEGITVRTFVPGPDDQMMKNGLEEAFGREYTLWNSLYLNRKDFDPTLWYLAMDGKEMAGGITCEPHPLIGKVNWLGVRPAWRGRGIATALLQHAFHDFHQRGLHYAELLTEETNPVIRLYQRAGMGIIKQIDSYTKTIYPS